MPESVGAPKSTRARAREIAKRLFRHENAVLVIILVVIIAGIAVMTRGRSITLSNVRNILLQSSSTGIASIGQAIVILTAGIDLSVGGLVIMTANLGAKLMTHRPIHLLAEPVPIAVGILLMLLIGLGIGTANGLSVSRLRMPPLVVTLAMWQMTQGATMTITEGHWIRGIPRSFAFFGQGTVAGVPVPVIIFIIVAVIAYYILNYTTFGKSVYAVGGNPVSAWLSGIRVPVILFSVYLICGFLASLAGFIILSRIMAGSMTIAAGLELDTIAAVVIGGISLFGGRGTLIGAVIGVMITGVIRNGMVVMAIGPILQQLVTGGVIFAAVAVDTLRKR